MESVITVQLGSFPLLHTGFGDSVGGHEVAKVLVFSPLVNLPPSALGGPKVVHHVRLFGTVDQKVNAVARLSLAPEGRSLTVKVDDRDGLQTVNLQLRRLGDIADLPEDMNLQVLELSRSSSARQPFTFNAEVVLGEQRLLPLLSRADHSPLSAALIAGLRPDAVLGLPGGGLPVEAPPAAQQPQSVQHRQGMSYLERRLSDELAAAAGADVAIASSRHVEMATHYARTIKAFRRATAQ